ncbi:hypothetical protein BB559_001508 [Furculomyces boomerangus]|uniref:Uncharacterized protein n=2 Tax=Harpellales TaxID=61421 RepID=A0A2T9Z1R5_9FUNG|nr:hypothetical protein BB559_001508 [Furculomyces boomerangus]PWA01702.1 hypothetical protein BB558_002185 [Smittium angustum]
MKLARFIKSRSFWIVYGLGSGLLILAILSSFARVTKNLKRSEHCHSVLDGGQWISKFNGTQAWQPYGCALKNHFSSELKECYLNTKLVFIGDNLVKNIYQRFISMLGNSMNQNPDSSTKNLDDLFKEKNYESIKAQFLKQTHVSAEYVHDVFLNGTKTNTLVETLLKNQNENQHVEKDSTIFIIQSGNSYLESKNSLSSEIKEWKTNIDKILKATIDLNESIKVYILPVLPIQENLESSTTKTLRYIAIDSMNKYLETHSKNIFFPSVFTKMTRNSKLQQINSEQFLESQFINLINNHECNPKIKRDEYPLYHYCCTKYPQPHGFIVFLLFAFLVLTPILIFLKKAGK